MRALNQKQRKFVKRYIETGNATQSAIDAGFSGVHGRRMLRNATIMAHIEKLREKAGLTDELLLSKHLELMEATKIQSCTLLVQKDADGKYKIMDVPGYMSVYAHKDNGITTAVVDVNPEYVTAFKNKLKRLKDKHEAMSKHMKDDSGLGTHAYEYTKWIAFDLLLRFNAHIDLDPDYFEQVLWQEYPYCWIDTRHAPRHRV